MKRRRYVPTREELSGLRPWDFIKGCTSPAFPGGSAERLTLLALMRHSGFDGSCWPSIPTIASETGFSVRRVRQAIGHLADAGLIEVQAEIGRPNVYTLVAETIQALGVVAKGQAGTTPRQPVPGSVSDLGSDTPAESALTPADSALTPAASAAEVAYEVAFRKRGALHARPSPGGQARIGPPGPTSPPFPKTPTPSSEGVARTILAAGTALAASRGDPKLARKAVSIADGLLFETWSFARVQTALRKMVPARDRAAAGFPTDMELLAAIVARDGFEAVEDQRLGLPF